MQQLRELQERFLELQSHTCAVPITPPGKGDSDAAKATTNLVSGRVDPPTTSEVSTNVGTPVQACSTNGNSVCSGSPSVPTSVQPKENVADAAHDLSTALLVQQLPPLPKLSG